MSDEGQTGSPFWDVAEEDKPDLQNLSKEQLISLSEKWEKEENQRQEKLNNEWKDKVPDDMIMMRDEIQYARYIIIGGVVLYLTVTISDGDATPLSPLQEQIWPLVIVAILSLLQFLVSRQHREVRWYAEEMTAVIYRKGLSGDRFVVSATILERGDELILNSETIWTKEGYDDDGHPVNKKETHYWIEAHRGGQRFGTFGDDWNNKRHLLATIDFLQEKIS